MSWPILKTPSSLPDTSETLNIEDSGMHSIDANFL